jgi:uncharacterized membrane protein
MTPVDSSQVAAQVVHTGYELWVERGAWAVELIAVVLIVGFIFVATVNWLYQTLFHRDFFAAHYETYRQRLGRSLLLGLEILVAADIVRTVALEPTLPNILGLGLLVLIRTFLSWSIVLEIEGRWPWQARDTPSRTQERI